MNIDELLREASGIKAVLFQDEFNAAVNLIMQLNEARCAIIANSGDPIEALTDSRSVLSESARLCVLCGNYQQHVKATLVQAHKALRTDITDRERQKALELSKSKDLEEYAAIRERYMLEAKQPNNG